MMTPIRLEHEAAGQIARLTLARPKANVLDAPMVHALREAVRSIRPMGPLKLLVIDAEGPHFSFGASVEEHLPDRVSGMLHGFHALFRDIEALGLPTASVVRGQCLGGGFELATFAGRVFCDRSARFAVPEVKLGVFPPVAAITLPWRLRGPEAMRLILSGRTVEAPEALTLGLADDLSDDANAALMAWFEADLAPHSAVAVRCAWRALRRPMAALLGDELAAVEHSYLDDLMGHADPVEGLKSFLERRAPVWGHR